MIDLPSYRWRLVHLAALWGYGVSQPVFSMLTGNPEFLVINGASRTEAVAFAVVLAFGPPLAAVALELVLGVLSTKAGALVHVLFVWLFGFTALLQVLELFDPSSRLSLAIPAVTAYAGAIAYTRWRPLRSFLSISVALPLLGLVVFLTTAPLALADEEGAHVSTSAQTPVVLVVFDEFPTSSLMRADGSIDADRYQGFGRLARGATWYSRATTVHENTTQAVPAILTGDVPREGALPTLADHPDNLFTLLGEPYAFQVREPVTRLCPVRYCPDHRSDLSLADRVRGLLHDVGINFLHEALPRDFRGDLSPLREGWGALVENTGASGQVFLATMKRSNSAQTLYFLHTLHPHVPWALLPSGDRYNDVSVIGGITDDWEPGKYEQWRDNEVLVEQGLQRHLLQVGDVDRFVVKLLDRLHETGLYDRALVVMTADHGVSFRPGGWRRHATDENVADIAAVPLFVKYPGQKVGREDPRPAKTIDILPTIADVLDIQLPWPVDGRSLRSRPTDRDVRIGRHDEPALVVQPRVLATDLRDAVLRNARWFGQGADSLYRIGPRRELLGRPVGSLPRMAARGADVEVLHELDLGNVNKSSGYVPVHILGRLAWGQLRASEDLAVAVNGRVAAMTRPFESKGDMWFEAMIDENVLHDGRNGVGVYAVRGSGRSTRLVHLGGNEGSASMPLAASASG